MDGTVYLANEKDGLAGINHSTDKSLVRKSISIIGHGPACRVQA